MQAQGQNEKGTHGDLEKEVEQQLELSEVWRQLLGLEALASPLTPVSGAVPVLRHDPWNHLVHEQGIQVVDLQQTHVHPAQTVGAESDVEHALNMMQENKPEK